LDHRQEFHWVKSNPWAAAAKKLPIFEQHGSDRGAILDCFGQDGFQIYGHNQLAPGSKRGSPFVLV
jgi:hypothetical protein